MTAEARSMYCINFSEYPYICPSDFLRGNQKDSFSKEKSCTRYVYFVKAHSQLPEMVRGWSAFFSDIKEVIISL